MCCFLTTLVLLGPRIAALVWWLIWPAKWTIAFGGNWIWPVLGIIFLPWTLLMYVIVFPVVGFWNWLFLILAIIVDISSFGGGFFGNRDRIGM
jgi:hypothetical protein